MLTPSKIQRRLNTAQQQEPPFKESAQLEVIKDFLADLAMNGPEPYATLAYTLLRNLK